jgi:ABC-2 type transport system ATP-binding protein
VKGRRRFWLGVVAQFGLASALVAALEPPRPTPAQGLATALAVGALLAVVLFVLLARSFPRLAVSPERRLLVAGKTSVLAMGAALEEVVWRWLVLGLLLPLGAPAALLLSTLGFAACHRGARAQRTHLVTGSVFGVAYICTGRLAAALVAHAGYNALVAIAADGARTSSRSPPVPCPARTDAAAALVDVLKRIGATTALAGVSFSVEVGEIVALLGPNGAGKTTAIRTLLGSRKPDRGRAFLFGRDPRDPGTRSLVGATPQETSFPETIRVAEILDFVRHHYADPEPTADVCARFGLAGLARRQTGGLSGGERRRLAVALAFAGRPRLVVLDEPTTGLDVESRRAVWAAIRSYAGQGGTVLLTTHHLEEAEALATRIVLLARGRVAASGSVAEIRARAGLHHVRVRSVSLPQLDAAVGVSRDGSSVTITTAEPGRLVEELVHKGVPLDDLVVTPVPLEDVFLELIGETSA